MNLCRIAVAPLVAVTVAVSPAGPAAADAKDDYLHPLLTKFSFLTSQQLLTEADKICRTIETGKASSEVEPMVTKDLQVSVPTALDIIFAAVAYLNC